MALNVNITPEKQCLAIICEGLISADDFFSAMERVTPTLQEQPWYVVVDLSEVMLTEQSLEIIMKFPIFSATAMSQHVMYVAYVIPGTVDNPLSEILYDSHVQIQSMHKIAFFENRQQALDYFAGNQTNYGTNA